jgi:hypothetical protein
MALLEPDPSAEWDDRRLAEILIATNAWVTPDR